MKTLRVNTLQAHVSAKLDDLTVPTVLAVGDPSAWREHCGRIPEFQNLRFISLEELMAEGFGNGRPELVVSPLVTLTFDCFDVARTLEGLGYRGAYRALAQDVPDPGMIVREIRRNFRSIDFDITVPQDLRPESN